MPSEYTQARREARRAHWAVNRSVARDMSIREIAFFTLACVVMLAGSLAILALIFAGWASALDDIYHFITGLL